MAENIKIFSTYIELIAFRPDLAWWGRRGWANIGSGGGAGQTDLIAKEAGCLTVLPGSSDNLNVEWRLYLRSTPGWGIKE